MKSRLLITLALVIAGSSGTVSHAQGTTAPLSLGINGGGSVSPLTNGEPLEVGQTYNMVAIPDPGFVFSSWQPVSVFTFTEFVFDPISGNTNTVVSTVASPVPAYTSQPSLDFTMQPVDVIYDVPGVRTTTKSSGWQANFDPVVLNIQFGGSQVILTWAHPSFILEAASTPGGAFTNILRATSPYTNSISEPTRYFRLRSN